MPKPKSKKNTQGTETKRVMEFKNPMEEYGKILKMLGSGQVKAVLVDGKEVFAHIAGRFKRRGRRRIWMNTGDVVILSSRAFQDSVYDICHLYKSEEVNSLLKADEIPPFFAETNAVNDTGDVIDFEEGVSVNTSKHYTQNYNEIGIDFGSESSDTEQNIDEFGNFI